MQRESIASQEEQAREAGRALRRDEIETQQEKSAAEHEAYFDAILADSQAALKAPRSGSTTGNRGTRRRRDPGRRQDRRGRRPHLSL